MEAKRYDEEMIDGARAADEGRPMIKHWKHDPHPEVKSGVDFRIAPLFSDVTCDTCITYLIKEGWEIKWDAVRGQWKIGNIGQELAERSTPLDRKSKVKTVSRGWVRKLLAPIFDRLDSLETQAHLNGNRVTAIRSLQKFEQASLDTVNGRLKVLEEWTEQASNRAAGTAIPTFVPASKASRASVPLKNAEPLPGEPGGQKVAQDGSQGAEGAVSLCLRTLEEVYGQRKGSAWEANERRGVPPKD